MKTRFLYIFCFSIIILFLSVTGCKKNDKDKYYGTDTIDNVLYGSQTYYIVGFSFDLGETTSSLETPPPDITIHVQKDIDNNITGKYFDTPNLLSSFALEGEYSSSSEARTAFNGLSEVGTRSWELSAMDVEENQVWLFKTSKGNYCKFRTIEIITDGDQNPPYIQIKFEWRIQPDGSEIFSE